MIDFHGPWTVYLGEAIFWTALVHLVQLIFNGRNAVVVFIEEFFCVIQVVVLSYESRVLRQAYGDWGFAISTFLNTVIFLNSFRAHRNDKHKLRTNVLGGVHYYCMLNRWPNLLFYIHFFTQLFSAWVGWQYLRLNLLRRDPDHIKFLADTSNCTTQIKVNDFAAMAIELALTFVFRLIIHKEKYYRGGWILTGLAAAACTLTGFPYTGGYFNPTVAFALQFNCVGAHHWEFFLVYFLGPIIGAIMAGFIGDHVWRLMPAAIDRNLRLIDEDEVVEGADGATHPDGRDRPRGSDSHSAPPPSPPPSPPHSSPPPSPASRPMPPPQPGNPRYQAPHSH